MATVSEQPRGSGRFAVLARKANGKRHPIRLAAGVTRRQAEKFADFVTSLESARDLAQMPDHATIAWLTSLKPALHERLSRAGLVESRGEPAAGRRGEPATAQFAPGTVGHLCAVFPATLNVEPQSLVAIGQTLRNLSEYFGDDRPVTTITAGDADEFRAWLTRRGRKQRSEDRPNTKPLAPATVSRRCRTASQVFAYAVRKRWCHDNPFDHMLGWTSTNPDKDRYIPAADIERIIADDPDLEFRTLLAMARWAGVRPSDALDATWGQVDWDRCFMHLVAPKTRRSRTAGHRDVPLFPRVRDLLDRLYAAAPEGSDYIFAHYRTTSHANLTDRLTRAAIRVGVLPWPKPWINLRASCENDWIDDGFDIFRVARWMGHAPDVALRHYNRVAKERSDSSRGDELLRNLLHPPAKAPECSKKRSSQERTN
jgi:integrase